MFCLKALTDYPKSTSVQKIVSMNFLMGTNSKTA